MIRISLYLILSSFLFQACQSTSGTNQHEEQDPKKQLVLSQLDSLKNLAIDGDLITRLSDDLISHQVKLFNEIDKKFSHAGIVITRNNQKMVFHIEPELAGKDSSKFEPIDSFLNPKKNLHAGLFRYDMNNEERKEFVRELNGYHNRNVKFDMVYDLNDDSLVYCTEMIYKSLKKATDDRYQFRISKIHPRLVPLTVKFFEGKVSEEDIKKRPFVAIDNLYLIPQCSEIMRFPLQYFPGQ